MAEGPPAFAYVAGLAGSGVTLHAFSIGGDGRLTPVAGSPFGSTWGKLAVDPSRGLLYIVARDEIRAYRVDRTGALSAVAGSPFPGFGFDGRIAVALDSASRLLHVAGGTQVCPGGIDYVPCNGHLRSYRIDALGGSLTEVPGSPFSVGVYPQRILLHPSGRSLFVVNGGYDGKYSGGLIRTSLSAFSVEPESGAVRPLSTSPVDLEPTVDAPTALSPAGGLLYVARFGWTPGEEPGIGMYVLGEDGRIEPRGFEPIAGRRVWAGLSVAPSGRFVFATFYNGDSPASPQGITTWPVDPATGVARPGSQIQTPILPGATRLNADGSILFLISHEESALPYGLASYTVDAGTGALAAAPGSPVALTPLRDGYLRLFSDPSGSFVFAAVQDAIEGYAVTAHTGTLTPLPGSPFPVPSLIPVDVAVVSAGR